MSCRHCDGKGQVAERGLADFFNRRGTKLRWVSCDVCAGRGQIPDDDEAEAIRRGFHIESFDDDASD